MIIGIDASRAFGRDRTGTENYSYHLINHMLRLPASRTHHFVLFTRPDALIPDWVRVSHAEVVTIPMNRLWTQWGLARATWRRYSRHITISSSGGDQKQITIPLDVLWIPAHTLPVLRQPSVRTVVTIHGLEYQWLPEYHNLLQRWYLPLSTYYAARYADHIIAVSAYTKKQLVALRTAASRISVIHEGVEAGQLVNSKNRDKQRGVIAKYGLVGKKYILFVGTVQPRKNLVDLITAFSRVRLDTPDLPAQAGLKLVIAGARGWMTADIYRRPVELGIEDRVIFTGRIGDSDLADLYSQATALVQPSLQEGFGLPVLEAMEKGVPVVTSDGGALPEVVGHAGLVVPLGSQFVRDLAQQLTRVVTDDALRRSLIAAGRTRVAALTWDVAAQKTLDVLTTST